MEGAPPVPPDVLELLELVPPPAPAVVALLVALAVLLAVDVAPPVPAVLLALAVVEAAPPGPEPVPVDWFVASPPQPAYIPARPTEARKPTVAAREAMLVKDRSMLASIPQARFLVLGSAP